MAVDDDVVAYLHIVAERELDLVERLEVAAAATKDARRQNAAETDPEFDVLPEWALVEHLPEPEQRLDLLVPEQVDVGVVFGFDRDVTGVELQQRHPHGIRQLAQVRVAVLRVVDVREDG